MSERLNTDGRQTVDLAHEEARRLGHGHVGTEHLLLGVLAGRAGQAARVLMSAGASLEACREKVAEAVGTKRLEDRGSAMVLTERASRALERAGRLALRLGADQAGSEEILLSVLDVEGTAGQVLRGLSVDVAALRSALAIQIRNGSPPEPLAALPSPLPTQGPGPLCAACGARLESTLAHRVLRAQGDHDPEASYDIVYCSACGSSVGLAARG